MKTIVVALLVIAAIGGYILAKSSGYPNTTLIWVLFFSLSGLILASLLIKHPIFGLLSNTLAAALLFFSWIVSDNRWYLIGAMGLAIAAVVALIKLKHL